MRLNDLALFLQEAMADEGFAFGQRHLTDPLIEQGFLADQKTGGVQPAKDFILRGQKPAAELRVKFGKNLYAERHTAQAGLAKII